MSNLKSIFKKLVPFIIACFCLAPTAVSAVGLPSNVLPGVAALSSWPKTEEAVLTPNSTTSSTSSDAASLVDKITIRAVNPGYTLDAGKNSGELIELANLTDDELPLDYLAIIYAAKPASGAQYGKSTILYRFPAGSKMVGKSILLRYKSAPEAADGNQDLIYDTSLAMTGSLALVQTAADADFSETPAASPLSDFGELISSVCWLGGEDCLPVFSTTVKSRSYTTILRDDKTGEYAHVADAELLYDPAHSGLYLPPEATENSDSGSSGNTSASSSSTSNTKSDNSWKDPQCLGLEFSEILSYYDADISEQFIELYNPTDTAIPLSGCLIRYKNKSYSLVSTGENPASSENIIKDTVIGASEYFVLRPAFRLTKNPTSENTLELIDVNDAVIATLSYPHGQKKSASYALVDYNADGSANWQITYAVTPGAANVYQQYRSCEEGKIINEATGNCVKASTLSSTLKDCGEGKYRNPATGRCKSYSSDTSELTPCKEGYERNPETNRCRKIRENNGTDYPVVPVTGTEEKTTFIALWALAGVAALGVLYVVFQFRREIKHFFRKLLGHFKQS